MNPIFHDSQLQQDFENNGYAIVDFLADSEIDHLLKVHQGLEHDLADYDFSATILSKDMQYRQRIDAEIKNVFRGKIASIFQAYKLCYCSLAIKQPQRQSSVVTIHQDWSFVDETQFDSVGIWCPLIDVNPQNGCLEVVRGSHRLNPHARGVLSQLQAPYKNLFPTMKNYSTQVPMKAGRAFLFTQKLFHSSPSNLTSDERVVACGLLIPEVSQLRCYHQKFPSPEKIEIFEVPDDFYTRYLMGTQPVDGKYLGTIDYTRSPLTEADLKAIHERLQAV